MEDSIALVQAMKILAEETGIELAELKEDLNFMDVGVDSLLSLTICGRFREELNLDVSPTLFVEAPTVKDLKHVLIACRMGSPSDAHSGEESKESLSTPGESNRSVSDGDDRQTPRSDTSVTSVEDDLAVGDHTSVLCSVMSEEIGMSVQEVLNAPYLAELGIDSLMSLTILGRIREEYQLDLPADILLEENMASIRKRLLGDVAVDDDASLPVPTSTDVGAPTSAALLYIPPATSVVLQGSIKTARRVLFLFPDGSGSASSYAMLPRIAPDIALVGLNCPFLKEPEQLARVSLSDLTAPYLSEIRRRQPHGPYYIGGWSAGGICAYDAVQKLMQQGGHVASLVLLDSPNPIGLQPLPVRLYEFLRSSGMFRDKVPEWLFPHFLAFIQALDRYEPLPLRFPGSATMKTHAIWAADGVYRSTGGRVLEESADDTREMQWLLHDRQDFGSNGWDQLLGRLASIEVLGCSNHFTMMQGEQAVRLSEILAKILAA
jgi:naphtho-gamma-pyrone polyketide synthase